MGMGLPRHLEPYAGPEATREARLKASRGVDGLAAEDLATLLCHLSDDPDREVSDSAQKTLAACPEDVLLKALASAKTGPAAIRKILESRGDSEAVAIMAALSPNIDDETLKGLASNGPEAVVEALTEDRERLGRTAGLMSALRKNPFAQKAALDEAEASLKETGNAVPAAGPQWEIEEEAKEEVSGEKEFKGKVERAEKEQNLYRLISTLTVGEKIKLALTGNKEARGLLVKQTNKVVVTCVLRNPRITEDEIIRVVSSRNISDEALRIVSRNKEWVKNYHIKKELAFNPKTPLPVALKLVGDLYEKDVAALGKSKFVPNAVAAAAKRRMDMKRH